MNQEHDYVSYLLRLWQVGGQDDHVWRVSLENPRTGKRHSFAGLADLFAFLAQETTQQETYLQESGTTAPDA